jgi:TatD DNase family protein
MKYFNIHTHLSVENPDKISVQNFIIGHDESIPDGLFSAGIHPWYLGENIEILLENLQKIAQNPNCFAIGECGLDRNIDTDLALQTQVFTQQIQLAETLQKPVIIHCVRAFSELISLKKKLKITFPMLVHGFNNNLQICEQLVQNGFYISLGAALLNVNSNASKVIENIPIQQLFLETDDKNFTIESIYKVTSEQLGIEIDQLQELMLENFLSLRSCSKLNLED